MIHDPAGCGLSWLPFWVCNFLSKFYNGFLSWWWNLISLSVTYTNVSAGRQEISAAGEIVPFSAGCWCKKDNLGTATFFALFWSTTPYENPLFSTLLSWKISYKDLLRCLLLVVRESSPSGSLSSVRVFNFLCCSVCVAYLLLPFSFHSGSAGDFHSCSGAQVWCS